MMGTEDKNGQNLKQKRLRSKLRQKNRLLQ